MPTYSVRVSGDLADDIDGFADAYEGSKSDALRELLERGVAYDHVRQENSRSQRAMRQLIEQRRENQELVEYVNEQRSIERQRAEQEQRRRSTNVFLRMWWFVAGEPTNQDANV